MRKGAFRRSWLVIVGQSFGSIALIAGFMGRVAAGGLFIIMTGAMITHLSQGWFMNWFGEKGGEGIEYFVMLLTMLLVVVVRGSVSAHASSATKRSDTNRRVRFIDAPLLT